MKVKANDDVLINGCKKGDKESFRQLFQKHSPWMMGICLRYCRNRNDAQDVMQETMIKVFNAITDFNFQSDPQFIAWMKRIAVNTSLNFIRSQAKDNFISLDENFNGITVSEEIEDYSETKTLSHEKLLEMINEMPAGYRAVFNMYVFEQMSHKEIAQELRISENTSKTQLLKARGFLKNKISNTVKTFTI
jgi:RNA polymerase sigma-70 factor, ECF subfamily